MNVRYRGRQTVNTFGEKLARPLEPAAIVTFAEDEIYEVKSILMETDYDYHFFGEDGCFWALVPVDSKDDYKEFMEEWKAGKEAYDKKWKPQGGGIRQMKSSPVKVSGKLFRYDFDRSAAEYIVKAEQHDIEFEREWKEKHGHGIYGIDESGYMVLESVGLSKESWKDAAVRKEYLTEWADELAEEEDRLMQDFIKNELPYLEEETR